MLRSDLQQNKPHHLTTPCYIAVRLSFGLMVPWQCQVTTNELLCTPLLLLLLPPLTCCRTYNLLPSQAQNVNSSWEHCILNHCQIDNITGRITYSLHQTYIPPLHTLHLSCVCSPAHQNTHPAVWSARKVKLTLDQGDNAPIPPHVYSLPQKTRSIHKQMFPVVLLFLSLSSAAHTQFPVSGLFRKSNRQHLSYGVTRTNFSNQQRMHESKWTQRPTRYTTPLH